MAIDKDLLRRVGARVTGADVHDVNGMIGAYNAAFTLRISALPFAQREEVRIDQVWSRAVLSEYADTGDIRAAKANHRRERYARAAALEPIAVAIRTRRPFIVKSGKSVRLTFENGTEAGDFFELLHRAVEGDAAAGGEEHDSAREGAAPPA